MVSILYILARMGSKMVQEKFKNLARIDPWELIKKTCKFLNKKSNTKILFNKKQYMNILYELSVYHLYI